MPREDADSILFDIGRRIAELREERGWTQEELAERASITHEYLSRVENGHHDVSVGRLIHLASHLGVRVVELFSEPRSREVRVGRPRRS